MRVLFSCAVGYGPFHSQVPLARALAGAGHEVAFATGGDLCPWVATVGFPAYPVGLAGRALLDEAARRFPYWPAKVPTERLLRFYLTRTAALVAAPATLVDLVPIIRHWRPQLVIHDPCELAAPLAAALAGIPSVNHGWGPLLPLEEYRRAAAAMAPLWERCRIEPRPLAGMFDHVYLDFCPRGLQTPEVSELPMVWGLRPVPVHLRPGRDPDASSPLPTSIGEAGARPAVYVTLGTVFSDTPGLFGAILDGLEGADVTVMAAIGPEGDGRLFERRSSRVHVEHYLPQAALLRRCDVVVCHGGAGTLLAALTEGVPVLAVPIGLDQFHNARCAAGAGAARWLRRGETDPQAVRREVDALLADPSYRRRARSVQEEIQAMPGPEVVAARLEAMVGAHSVVR